MLMQHVLKSVLYPTVQHGVNRLMDQQRSTQSVQNFNRFFRLLGCVAGDPDIESFSLADDLVESTHCFFQRSIRVKTMGVENIDVIKAHAF
ncbi:hypothetical protein D3C71_1988910 [compost metagenome]